MQEISLTLFLLSFLVLAYFIIKKAPELVEFDEGPSKKRASLFLKTKERIFGMSFLKEISWNVILQKVLSRTRIAVLKIENKIGDQLHFLRKKSKNKK